MLASSRPFLAPLLLLATGPLTAQDPPLELAGDHFKIVSHFGDKKTAQQALDTVEAAWKAAVEVYGGAKTRPQAPLAVHLYRDKEAFEAAEQALTAGKNKEALAFTHAETQSAHLAVVPEMPDAVLQEHGLGTLTLRRLAQHAANLSGAVLAPNHKLLPEWLTQGASIWIAAEVLRGMDLCAESTEDPYLSTLLLRAQSQHNQVKLPTPAEILTGATSSLEDWQREAAHATLFEFAMQKKFSKRLTAGIAAAIKLGEDAYESKKTEKAIDKTLKAESLEKPWKDWLRDVEPVWNERVASLETCGKEWRQTAPKDDSATAWQNEDIGPKPWTIRGAVSIEPAGGQQMNLLVGGGGEGYLMIAFAAGQGLHVWEFKATGEQWEKLGEKPSGAITVGKPIEFEVSWDRKRELAVTVAGEELFRQKLTRSMDGPWGLGAQPGTCGTWIGLQVQR